MRPPSAGLTGPIGVCMIPCKAAPQLLEIALASVCFPPSFFQSSGVALKVIRSNRRLAIALSLAMAFAVSSAASGQQAAQIDVSPTLDPRIYDIVDAVSAERIEADIRKLVGFGTRNTFSDAESPTRGIGAARRWIKAEFDAISEDCSGCLQVSFHRNVVPAGGRVPRDTEIVNALAVIRGTEFPDRYLIMSGDIDSRASSGSDGEVDAPGANDNASGMAGTIEAARVLSQYQFPTSVLLVGLSGEEQGLIGGRFLAETAVEEGWDIVGVLNNDMIGNIEGVDGVIDNSTFRVFSEPQAQVPEGQEASRWDTRRYGGEVDGPSRQLARYVARITDMYFTNVNAMMIYRLDRFGRGGHHTPFNNAGFPAVRIMETHENYVRQHQDIRVDDGISYGDVIEGVNFDYARKLTGVNAAVLASLAWAPPAPTNVRIGGAVRPSTTLAWDPVVADSMAGYKVYWRETTEAQWKYFRYVGDVTEYTLEGIVIDNYMFGVASVGRDGNESVVTFPSAQIRRRR